MPPEASSPATTPSFQYETSAITVLSTQSEIHPHHPLLSVRNEVHNCTFHPKRGPPPPPPAFGMKRVPQLYCPPKARSTLTTPCFRYKMKFITVLVMDLVCINQLCVKELFTYNCLCALSGRALWGRALSGCALSGRALSGCGLSGGVRSCGGVSGCLLSVGV